MKVESLTTAASLLVASFALAACGSAVAGAPPATIGSVEATPEELGRGSESAVGAVGDPDDDQIVIADEAARTSTAIEAVDEPTASQEPIGPPLSPGSTSEQILEVVSDIHGPTLDVAGQMNRLLDFPSIPTATDTTITELRADVRQSFDGGSFVVTAEVVLRAAGPVDGHADFYQEAFAALGWRATAVASDGLGTSDRQRLGFEIPDSAYAQDDVELILSPAGDGSGDGATTRTQLRYVALVAIDDDGSPRNRLDSWAGEMPLPAGSVVTGAAVQTSDLARRSLHYSLALRYDGTDPQTIADRLRGALPAGDYSEQERPSMGQVLDTWVYLQHPLFDEARVSPHMFGRETDPVVTVVNVNARLEF